MGKRLDPLLLALWLGALWLAGRFDKAWLRWQIRREERQAAREGLARKAWRKS